MTRLVLLSGPSCVGKGPLLAALKRIFPSLAGTLHKVLLYNDRRPRPAEENEVEYHFRSREEILAFRERGDFIVLEVRPGNFQALARKEIEDALRRPGIPFLEAFYKFREELLNSKWLKRDELVGIFLSPLTEEEILFLKGRAGPTHLREFVAEVMRRKLLRRTQRQKGLLSRADLDDIEIRVGTAYEELKGACRYDYVIPNHDGEDSDNWDLFYYPIGDARSALFSFVDLLEGKEPRFAEKWPESLIP